jgi:hypothetical protein
VYEYVEMPETPFLDPYSYLLVRSNLFCSSPLGACFRVPQSSPGSSRVSRRSEAKKHQSCFLVVVLGLQRIKIVAWIDGLGHGVARRFGGHDLAKLLVLKPELRLLLG